MRSFIWIFLFVLLSFQSCRQKLPVNYFYPQDSTISDRSGKLYDSLSFYFPYSITRNGRKTIAGIDTFGLNWYSTTLHCFHEPILYNYYTGHDIYRFLWLRSFSRPVVISLHNTGEKVWLNLKELNKQPRSNEYKIAHFPADPSDNSMFIIDSIVEPDRKADILRNDTILLSQKEWNEFNTILDSCFFWSTAPYEESPGLDGSEWLIEAHLENDYWFVNRWSPKGRIRKAGMYLIEKSGFKEPVF